MTDQNPFTGLQAKEKIYLFPVQSMPIESRYSRIKPSFSRIFAATDSSADFLPAAGGWLPVFCIAL